MEENTNLQATPNWDGTYSTPSLMDFANTFNTHQFNLRKTKQQQNYNRDMQLMQDLDAARLNTKDHWVATESSKAIRKTQVAYWIREFYNTNYGDDLNREGLDLNNMTNEDVINWYLDFNNSSEPFVKEYITTDKDINNPLDFYNTMGWLPTKKEKDLALNLDWTWRWIKWTAQWEMSWIDETYIWIRNFVNGIQWMWDDDAAYFWAMQNYAHDVLWKDVSQLSDLEIYWITEALKDKETYDDFKPTPQKWLTKTVAWVTDTMFTIAVPWAKLAISWLAADPLTWWSMEALARTQIWLWETVSWLVPPLRAFRSSLTDTDKIEFDAWVGSLVTMWLLKKYWGKWKPLSKETYTKFIETIWADKIIDWFNNKLKPTNLEPVGLDKVTTNNELALADIETKMTPLSEVNKTTEELYNQAAKIWDTTRAYENKKVSDALSQIWEWRLQNIQTYWQLHNAIRENIDYVWKLQDSILDTFKRTIDESNDKVWGTIDWWNDIVTDEYDTPVRDRIKTMRNMRHDWKWRSTISAVEQMFNKWKLDTSHLYKMKRALNAEFRKFKKWLNSPEEVENARKNVSRISDQLTEVARSMINKEPAFKELWLDNVLEYTDSLQSSNLYTRDLIWDIINKINRYNADIPNSNAVKTTWRLLGKILNITASIKWLAWWLEWPSKMNPVEREAQLNSMLKKRDSLNKQLWKTTTTKEIETALEKFNKEYQKEFWNVEDEWPLEWEVFDPEERENRDIYDSNKYLEDIITIERPESFMLNEDPKYNWQDGIDYTTPTRVTPEGYAGRYWQTLESWKQWLRNWWMSEENINKYMENLEKNNFTYKQEPLVKYVEEDLLTDNNGSVLSEADMAKLAAQKDRINDFKKTVKWTRANLKTLKKGIKK